MEKLVELENGIEFYYKQSPNTPRVSLCMNFLLNDEEKIPGLNALMTRLFMQGTKTRSAEKIAQELDENAIEMNVELKLDYLSFRFTCLNEDLSKAVEILEDIVKNTTFDDYKKEILKYKADIKASLESPVSFTMDGFYKTLFENHPYGATKTVILPHLDEITQEDLVSAYKNILLKSVKVIVLVGDVDYNSCLEKIKNAFENLDESSKEINLFHKLSLTEIKRLEQTKDNLNQAHIIKGWLVDGLNNPDYPALMLLNVILGASGLSSRLFCELRDKKGLAYVVRTTYETALSASNFYIYIATEPKNIEKALAGFKEEIGKIKDEKISQAELDNAKSNLTGKWAFSYETNQRQANLYAHYGIMRLGFDFIDKTREKVYLVTIDDIYNCANKYFIEDRYVLSILKP